MSDIHGCTGERLLVGDTYEDHGLVFCWPDGLPYHPEACSKSFDRKIRQAAFAEVPVIRLHDLRHTWATLRRLPRSCPRPLTWTYDHFTWLGGEDSNSAPSGDG